MKKLNTFSKDIPLFAKSLGLTESQSLSFLNDGGIMGSGATANACILKGRNYIGSEISKEYCEIIKKRIESVQSSISL